LWCSAKIMLADTESKRIRIRATIDEKFLA